MIYADMDQFSMTSSTGFGIAGFNVTQHIYRFLWWWFYESDDSTNSVTAPKDNG